MCIINKKWRKLLIVIIAIETVSFIILFLYELEHIKDPASLLGLTMAFISILLTVISLCEKSPSEKIDSLSAKIDDLISKTHKS